jgi:hypothetical protein
VAASQPLHSLAMAANRVLFLGDSADAPVALIQQLLAKSRHSRNIQLFIHGAVEAVGRESKTLTPAERDTIGVIHSIQDLEDCYDGGRDRFGIARTVLIFIARVGELILYVKKHLSKSSS